jgi:uncharacterized protein YbgA (DUF1722 family)/uncharacterized protein YbbK (DUF523 family)
MKPKILISRCLEHSNCRYDGSIISSDFVKLIKPFVDFVTICPEVDMGLSIPRESIRLVMQKDLRLLGYMSGDDFTPRMQSFLEDLEIFDVDGAILKSRSPSCGINGVKVYKDIGKVPCLEFKEQGFFGKYISDNYPYIPLEDEGRLRNFNIREHFLTRLYITMAFRDVADIQTLIQFQSDYKYLLMAYHQSHQKKMGNIIANNSNFDETREEYRRLLNMALSSQMKPGRNINMMMHIFGYFSKYLNNDEKGYFLDQLELYRNRKLPMSSLMNVLYVWVLRFDINYLKRQKIFRPYPKEIMDIMDSGKGASK